MSQVPAVTAVKFYDLMREYHTERAARQMAELYMRRKVEGMDADGAAVALADALAQRAAARTI